MTLSVFLTMRIAQVSKPCSAIKTINYFLGIVLPQDGHSFICLPYENSCLLKAINTIAGIPTQHQIEQMEPASAKPQALLLSAQSPPATATIEIIIATSPTINSGVTSTVPTIKPRTPAAIVKLPAIVGFHVCAAPTDSKPP
jgi:hypothetical protein